MQTRAFVRTFYSCLIHRQAVIKLLLFLNAALVFSAGFGPSSFAVIAPRCAAPRKLELTSAAVRHHPLPLLLLVTGLQRNICVSDIDLPRLILCAIFGRSKVSRLRNLRACFTPVVPTRLWWCQVKSWPFPSLSVAVYCHSYYRSKYTNAHKIKHLLKFVQADFRTYLVSFPAGLCRSPPLMIAGGRVFVIPCIQQIQRLAFK